MITLTITEQELDIIIDGLNQMMRDNNKAAETACQNEKIAESIRLVNSEIMQVLNHVCAISKHE